MAKKEELQARLKEIKIRKQAEQKDLATAEYFPNLQVWITNTCKIYKQNKF